MCCSMTRMAGEREKSGERSSTPKKRLEVSQCKRERNQRRVIPREYLRAIADCVGDPIFVKDRHHRLVFVNDAACEMFGKPRGQLVGKTDEELFAGEHADVFRKADDAVFETGEEHVDEEQITDARGNVRRIITRRTLCGSEAGEKYLIVTIRDITEAAKAEEALLESEVKYRTVVENSLAGVYIYQDNLFRFVNKRWCEIYGYACEEVVDKLGAMDITHPEERRTVQEHVTAIAGRQIG